MHRATSANGHKTNTPVRAGPFQRLTTSRLNHSCKLSWQLRVTRACTVESTPATEALESKQRLSARKLRGIHHRGETIRPLALIAVRRTKRPKDRALCISAGAPTMCNAQLNTRQCSAALERDPSSQSEQCPLPPSALVRSSPRFSQSPFRYRWWVRLCRVKPAPGNGK